MKCPTCGADYILCEKLMTEQVTWDAEVNQWRVDGPDVWRYADAEHTWLFDHSDHTYVE